MSTRRRASVLDSPAQPAPRPLRKRSDLCSSRCPVLAPPVALEFSRCSEEPPTSVAPSNTSPPRPAPAPQPPAPPRLIRLIRLVRLVRLVAFSPPSRKSSLLPRRRSLIRVCAPNPVPIPDLEPDLHYDPLGSTSILRTYSFQFEARRTRPNRCSIALSRPAIPSIQCHRVPPIALNLFMTIILIGLLRNHSFNIFFSLR
jgi:hypothetical protein